MSMSEDQRTPLLSPELASRVAFSPGPDGFAYVPRRVLVRGEAAARHLDAVTGRDNDRTELGGRADAPEAAWTLVDVEDPLAVAAAVRSDGFAAQPDHVLFAHGCDPCGCGPHPSMTFDALLGDPLRGNPLRGNPLRGNPLRGNPFVANPLRGNEAATSSARPAAARSFPVRGLAGPGAHPRITVIDTGLAEGGQRPPLLTDPNSPNRISGASDKPDSALTGPGGTVVWPKDGWLDPVAGHGTFIAGLLEQLAPGCSIRVEHALSPLGDASESDVLKKILDEAALPPGQRPDILSLSFGGTVVAQAPALRSAITVAQLAGIVIVASAGNDGSCEPQYPAAYDGVIAVGALGPDGPTPWTNYGEWVDACAPAVDLVSSFFAGFDGPQARVNTVDTDRFEGWATWSGTSFAAPVVVAALAREMVLGKCGAKDAVERVVHAPEALRIRCLGTVVSA
jgi:hypothetical protein